MTYTKAQINEAGAWEEVPMNAAEVAEMLAAQTLFRRLLPKSTVTARLIAMGKAADVKAAFDQDPEAFFRWVAPDWPKVYADDEGLLSFLGEGGLGLTAEQIATVVA